MKWPWKKAIEVNWKNTFLAAVAFTIIAQIFHSLFAFLGMSYYTNELYFPVWSELMMPTAGPPPFSFTLYSLLFGFIIALIYAYVYNWVKSCIQGKTLIEKGLCFGLGLFLVSNLPGYLAMILLINLPLGLIGLWLVESLLISLIGGLVIMKIIA
jgi:hypothetical protein